MKPPENTTEVDLKDVGCSWEEAPVSKTETKPMPKPYLRGPILWSWLQPAIGLGSGALPTGLAIWHLRTLNKKVTFKASLNQLRKWTGLSEKVTREGVHRLEAAELVKVERRDGQSLVITLLGGPPPVAKSRNASA
jgi:hypothetical protein